ncbi:hypothetical protein ANN_14520 [Periplaneta americana]|uniref:Uncharacterized protein n=1 Tax=Periplaneta americana TaxID=6978 RepID=A0ABQ8SXS9_PERAM|nr:hypothetical protein ANN_14520 [Periplaneta americana]
MEGLCEGGNEPVGSLKAICKILTSSQLRYHEYDDDDDDDDDDDFGVGGNGHLIRKEEAEIPKRVMLTQPDGTRRKGRPRSRWIDGVDGDARALGVRNWGMVALDRDGWRRVLEEAKTQQ